jgi:XTP/dITP diphosphohydrolase/ATP diphosphatase
MALRNCNLRFRQRFSEMERAAPRPLEDLSPPELEALWVEAKKKLANGPAPSRLDDPQQAEQARP